MDELQGRDPAKYNRDHEKIAKLLAPIIGSLGVAVIIGTVVAIVREIIG